MSHKNLTAAKAAKNDEFYTQYADIEKEINAYLKYDPDVFRGKTVLLPCDDPEWSNFTAYFRRNFRKLGMKRLISTCISQEARRGLFGDPAKRRGRYLDMTAKESRGGELAGDGDFRSTELCALRDEADMVVTNPPFSLFREFVAWLMDGGKQFLIIGNMNAITYNEVFPQIKENRVWLGGSRPVIFGMQDNAVMGGSAFECDGRKYVKLPNVVWFTNIEHGHRHPPLELMTMEENKRYSRHKEVRGHDYAHYDNYNAIEVPYVDAIPSDYDGVMGVPISFLNKYCPEQFEIMGVTQRNDAPYKTKHYSVEQYKNANDLNASGVIIVKGVPKIMYHRILIRRKHKQ